MPKRNSVKKRVKIEVKKLCRVVKRQDKKNTRHCNQKQGLHSHIEEDRPKAPVTPSKADINRKSYTPQEPERFERGIAHKTSLVSHRDRVPNAGSSKMRW